jgi:hypothetical protein
LLGQPFLSLGESLEQAGPNFMKIVRSVGNLVYLFVRDLLPTYYFPVDILYLLLVLVEVAELALTEFGPRFLVLLVPELILVNFVFAV